MPDLNYQIDGAKPEPYAAVPLLNFALRVNDRLPEGGSPSWIRSVLLRCQVRIEPARRSYSDRERQRLLDVFGTSDRWGQMLRPMLWSHLSTVVPPSEGSTTVELPAACSYDFSLAATKYFAAIETGDLPFCFLFNGTIFYETDAGALQVAQIPWEKEATFRMPANTLRALMDLYYPNQVWLDLHKDVFDRLNQYRTERSLTTWDHVLNQLLDIAEEPVVP